MKIAVTGLNGQVVSALLRQTVGAEITALGRPTFDLTNPDAATATLVATVPDVIVSAAAYTMVDRAEDERELAFAINKDGAAAVARAATILNIPIVHISTDYVFNGENPTPYSESDPVSPLGVYGASKLAGEELVAQKTDNHVILRTAWVYSPFGTNFVKTMLRLAGDRDEVRVVADQIGNPTSALDVAAGIISVAKNLIKHPQNNSLRGIFHMSGSGSASWADFATEIFAQSRLLDGPEAKVTPISTREYPTPAPRPANSQLDCSKLFSTHDVSLPDWRISTAKILREIIVSEFLHQPK
jgi:dTDP-4-dehydrorhamnose reductase